MSGIRTLASAAMAALSLLPACGGSDTSFVCDRDAGRRPCLGDGPGQPRGRRGTPAT